MRRLFDWKLEYMHMDLEKATRVFICSIFHRILMINNIYMYDENNELSWIEEESFGKSPNATFLLQDRRYGRMTGQANLSVMLTFSYKNS